MSLDLFVWLAVMASGLIVAIYSSKWAVGHLTKFAAGTKIPPFLIGITLVSVGTDLPEIAASIVASVIGHGDINVGDSIGSATVQSTLILGLLPFVAGAAPINRRRVARIGVATVAALLLGAALMADGDLTRWEAAVLIVGWVFGVVLIRHQTSEATVPLVELRMGTAARHLILSIVGLALVGVGATAAVEALTRLAEILGLPEYMIAFVLGSAGSSLPELMVDVTAARRGHWDLAVGDALGSSFVDSTLSLAIGPLIAPIAVTTSQVVTGSLAAAAAIGLSVLVLTLRQQHDRRSGWVLLGVLALVMLMLFTVP